MRRNFFASAFSSVLVAILIFVRLPLAHGSDRGNSAFARHVQIPGAKPVGSDTCAACHEDVAKNFTHAYHAQQGVQCEQCHGNGSLHVEGGGDVTKIFSPGKRPAAEANELCLSCHAQEHGTRHWLSGVHAANGVRCIDCHQVHATAVTAAAMDGAPFSTEARGMRSVNMVSPETDALVRSRAAANANCVRCHRTQEAQLSMPYHHPLREGKMSCTDCHDPHGGAGGHNLRTANVNELCLGCHAQYRGPFAYQHPPVSENCLNCHTPHGSPNSNLLTVSMPALCLQCHAGHHNGAALPIAERCTNCHSSIHGTDVATPSGGSRFVDKGPWGVPSEPAQPGASASASMPGAPSGTVLHHARLVAAAAGGPAALLSARLRPFPTVSALQGGKDAVAPADPGNYASAGSVSYRFLDITGFAGRAGEYDSLEQSAGSNVATTYVAPARHLTLAFRGAAVSGSDYSVRSQLTVGEKLKAGLDLRSLVQQQDHYPNYLAILSSDFAAPGAVTDDIPANARFSITRRLGSAYANVKAGNLPVHLMVAGNWQARTGASQFRYLDENSTPAVYVDGANTTCGELCHAASRYQPVNNTTRNITGGAEARLRQILRVSYFHTFSRFNDRLQFPTGSYTGPFTPEDEGPSILNPPPSGPAPLDVPAGNYYLDIPSPSQFSSDAISVSLTPSAELAFNGQASYTRLRNTFTHNPQNWFDSDETLTWSPEERLRVIADYHQHNTINGFTPYYTLYGNASYHRHWEGLEAEYELRGGLSVETFYRRNGITRSNSALWPQAYSMDNTDLQTMIPSSSINNSGLALRYHSGLWNARLGYSFAGTDHPGYLIVPGSNNRSFATLWLTPGSKFTFTNETFMVTQNAFPSIPLPNTPGNFQRRNRIYTDAANATLRPMPGWDLGLGYSYQQNNLRSYMAFQNDDSVGYVVDEPAVVVKQLSREVWGNSTYSFRDRAGLDLRFTHNGSNSGYRPDLNANDASALGNASLIQQEGFDPNLFQSALDNLAFSSTQISEVKVPQWIGEGKAYYRFPHRIEGGTLFNYGSYGDHWNPNRNGVLRTFDVYIGRTW